MRERGARKGRRGRRGQLGSGAGRTGGLVVGKEGARASGSEVRGSHPAKKPRRAVAAAQGIL